MIKGVLIDESTNFGYILPQDAFACFRGTIYDARDYYRSHEEDWNCNGQADQHRFSPHCLRSIATTARL